MMLSTEKHSTCYAHKNLHLLENKQKEHINYNANALKIQNLQSPKSSGLLGGSVPAVAGVIWRERAL